MRARVIALLLLVALVASACGPALVTGGTPEATLSATDTPVSEPTPTPTEPGRSPGEMATPDEAKALRAVASTALEDLSTRLGIPAERIDVAEVKEVDWPDTSLGCPRPGMAYAQVITNGMQVILEAEGKSYDYHGRAPQDLFLCLPGGPAAPAEPPAEADRGASLLDAEAQAMVNTVTDDLARTLGVSPDEIEVVSVEEVMWRSSALGCEKPGEMYLQVITPGYKIVLSAAGQPYEYHTDTQGNFVQCSDS